MKNQLKSCALIPFKRCITVGLLTIASFAAPLTAIASQSYGSVQITAQAETTPAPQPLLDACVQNRAETLPNPFTDVPRNHWAFKAVLTLHYCGAYRQAAPPRLIEQSTKQRFPDQTPQTVP
ncbi:MAG: S-layer protein [Stenomitos rutilans HA7619-LM2]|jgi:hypothetical protein|nr:S-layer protein [Stenomitos rutilans HA7619-LM2]